MISKDDWKEIEKRLNHAYGRVEMIIDGYKITFDVQREKGLKYIIMTHVNGWFRGEWLSTDCEERKRFFQKKACYIMEPKRRARYKKLSKKAQKYIGLDPDKKFEHYTPGWSSFKPLKAHLLRNNTDFEWIDRPVQKETPALA